jgi:phage FluMu protein Com
MTAIRCTGCNHIVANARDDGDISTIHRGREVTFRQIVRIRCERCGTVTTPLQPRTTTIRRGPALGEAR